MALEIIQDVTRGKLHSAYAVGAFDRAEEALKSKGYRVISLEEQAGLRMERGISYSISSTGNWVREGFIHIPKKGVFLTKDSPIMANAKDATDCHRNDKEFYLNDEQVEKSLANSVKVTDNSANIVCINIPTRGFGYEAITNFAFGKNASAYGEFIHDEYGIYDIGVCFAHASDKPFARPTFLQGVDACEFSSGLSGLFDRNLSRNLRMRGIKKTA